jgi:hypothetical protein
MPMVGKKKYPYTKEGKAAAKKAAKKSGKKVVKKKKRKPGAKGAPTAKAFRDSKKTAKSLLS